MIARINDFQGLYFDPAGHSAVFVYRDRPGVLGRIGAALADANINIDDVRNPHDSSCEKSIAIIKVNQNVPTELMNRIAADIEAETWFCMSFGSSKASGA
jgi:D-3-phosphoglycerate dehydrogenase